MRFVALLLVLLTSFLGTQNLNAQEGDSAGLVIVSAEGEAQTYCVEVGDEATGWDLLVNAGLAVNSEPMAVGQSICSINGVGCKSPQQSCFCQCQGSPCVYWSYWVQNDAGAWVYSNQGASGAKVRPGEVQGWVWGDGTTGKAPAPPAVAFGDICAVDGDLVADGLVGGGLVEADSVVSTPVVAASTSTPDDQTTETPNRQNTETPVAWTMLVVLLPLPIILALYLWRRR